MSHWDFSQPPAGHDDEPQRPGTADEDSARDKAGAWDKDNAWNKAGAWNKDSAWNEDNAWNKDNAWNLDEDPQDEDAGGYPLTYERDDPAGADADGPADAAPLAAGFAGTGLHAGAWPDWEDDGAPREWRRRWYARDRDRAGRRWLMPAAITLAAAALGALAGLLTSGPGSSSGAGTTGPGGAAGTRLTQVEAQAVLAAYTAGANAANAQRSDTRLAAIETGSSYAIDAARYRAQAAADAAAYPSVEPLRTSYYIPRDELAGGPRWFVVQVTNALTSSPATVTSSQYLLFTQAVPGGSWLVAVEPYLLPTAPAHPVAVGSDGLATAVGPAAEAAVAPGQLPAQTASSLDVASSVTTGLGPVRPANGVPPGVSTTGLSGLADQSDLRLWHREVPAGTVTDVHAPAAGTAGLVFALRTADGGALVFYTDAATLTVAPPSGWAPNGSQPVTQAGVSYLEQFATYDPPPGGGNPRVLADYSAATGTG